MTTTAREAALAARLAALTPQQRQLLRQRMAAGPAEAGPPVLTPGQLRLWRTQQEHPEVAVDVVCQAVRLRGPVSAETVSAALTEFVRGQEALRTTFDLIDGNPVPRVHAELTPDIGRVACPGGESEAHRLAAELAGRPFDLGQGPLLRVVLADAAPDELWLLLAVHNLVFDAWSFELLLDALGGKTPLGEHRFTEFARTQRDWAAGPGGLAAAEYWRAEVADAPGPLPTDLGRDGVTAREGRRHAFDLPTETAAGLTAVANTESASAFAAWLAVLWAVLAEFGGDPDVLLGTFSANRDQPGTAETAGYFLNVLPVRLRDSGSGSFRDRVRHVRGVVRQGQRHGRYPVELVLDEPPRGRPLFDTVFVFDHLGEGSRHGGGVEMSTADIDRGTARYDLTFAVYAEADRVHGWVEYDTARYEAATVARLAERFTETARRFAVDPDAVPALAAAPEPAR